MKTFNLKIITAFTRILVTLSILVFTIMSSQVLIAQSDQSNVNNPDAGSEIVPDEFIVKFKTNVAEYVEQAMLQDKQQTGVPQIDLLNEKYNVRAFERVFKFVDSPHANTRLVEKYGLDRTFIFNVPAGTDIKNAVSDFATLPDVDYAEPNYIDHATLVPDDPTYLQQWGLNNTGQAVPLGGGTVGTPGADINAEAAWDLHTGDASIILAILDSGVDYNHPEFAGRTVPGTDTGDDDGDPMDSNGHGTNCAGIAAATGNNAQGVAGVNWNCMIMPVKIGPGASSTFTHADGADGMVWAADHGADVLSCSYGGSNSATKQAGVDYAYAAGCVIVAASGNDNLLVSFYPASYSNVLSIGALSPCNDRKSPGTCDGETWWGSNYGPDLDVMAPGTRIHSTDILGSAGKDPGDYNATFNGTSAACPFASGVAALIRSYVPVLTHDQVYECIRMSAVDIGVAGVDDETGHGRLNAFGALNYAAALVNTPPVAICQDVITSADGDCEANVSPGEVDNGSYDPDGDPITLSLAPAGPYPLGVTTVTLTVSDAYTSSTCTALINVIDDTPPTVTCLADMTMGNDPGDCGAIVSYALTAIDNCDDDVNIVIVPASGSFFPVGTTTATATATDDSGNTDVCSFDVTVSDTEPPVINTITAPIVLWPPNHKYVSLSLDDFILSVSDNCTYLEIDDVIIASASSDEPEDAEGIGDGNTLDDIVIAGDCKSIQLRKERAGDLNGRVYTLYFELTDAYGNEGTASAEVHVPIDIGYAAVNDGMAYEELCSGDGKSAFLANTEEPDGPILEAYPNPFSESTIILFRVAMNTSATVKVYNALGAQICTLYNGIAEKGREYLVRFNSGNLPEGVYYYNLQTAGGISITNRLIMTK
ncbi:MAG: S8 family serine peptidase [Bacteroidota bacterium]